MRIANNSGPEPVLLYPLQETHEVHLIYPIVLLARLQRIIYLLDPSYRIVRELSVAWHPTTRRIHRDRILDPRQIYLN
jgi:hypothetical protein